MIGIIGGNGVAATNKLCQLVEEQITQKGAFRDVHHPEMLVWQATQVPSRSMYLEGRGESFIFEYVRIGKLLKECGCDKLCMCCNTAHYAIDVLQNEIGLPFVNLLDEVAKKVNDLKCNKVGMMCSDGLKKVSLYDERFKLWAPETQIIYPNEEIQGFVTKGICNAKNTNRLLPPNNEESPVYCFEKVCNYFIEMKVDCIVAGCTDICNVFSLNNKSDIKYVDSLEILADYIVNKSQ